MTASQVGLNDAVLVFSLLYLSLDLQYEWDAFEGCHKPIHKWLLVSYGLVVVSRLVYVAGAMLSTAGGGDFLLDLRQKDTVLQVLTSLTWLAILPAFTAWSVVGTLWIWDVQKYTPKCLPSGAHLWFLAIWHTLSYFWIIIHGGLGAVIWFLERRLRRAEGELRQLEDPDLLARWGQVSRLQGYTAMPSLPGGEGLSPSQINALPGANSRAADGATEEECPICLNAIRPGDQVRELSGCSHCFHRSCIDLWLVRRADCPLCKGKVAAAEPEVPTWSV